MASPDLQDRYAVDDLKAGRDKDNSAREELRKALTDNAAKTSDAIAQLATHAAIQDERTKTMADKLNNINDQLTTLNATTAVRPVNPTK